VEGPEMGTDSEGRTWHSMCVKAVGGAR